MTRKFLLLPILAGLMTSPFAASAQTIYAADRKPFPGDEIAIKQPGGYINGETASWKPGYWDNSFAPGMTKRTDKMLALIKETFPGPTGFDVLFSRAMDQHSYGLGGSRSYSMTFGCQTYAVAKELAKRQTYVKKTDDGGYIVGGNGGPTLVFKVNDPTALYSSGITLDLDGRSAHMTFSMLGTWKGCTAFGTRFFSDEALTGNGVLYLLIARSGENPYLPFTRKEFLQAQLNRYDEEYSRDTANFSKSGQNIQRQIDEAQRTGKSAAVIASLQKDLKFNQQAKIDVTKRNSDKRQANKKPILAYLASKPADSLALPAVVYSFRDGTDVQEWFKPQKGGNGALMYVVDNPAYWHNNADKATPQLIILKMQFSTQMWREYEVKKQFMANFPVEKFQALLDN